MTKDPSWDDLPPLANGKPLAKATKADLEESAAEYGRRATFDAKISELSRAEHERRQAWLIANPPD
jgi:hypothetical protein